MAFPNAKTTFSAIVNGTTKVVASLWNLIHTDVEAIETFIGAIGSTQANTDSIKNLLGLYVRGCDVEYKGDADLYVRAGRIMIQDASGNMRLRTNASDLTVTWANIDTGSEANSTLYYVYAVADAAGTEFTIKVSTNAATPTGCTFYRLLGSFYNNADGNIEQGRMTNTISGLDLSMLKDVAGMTEAEGDIIYRDANGKWNRLAKGTEGYILLQGASIPAWGALPAASVITTMLKTATSEVSGSNANLTLAGGQYCFYPQIKSSDATYSGTWYIGTGAISTDYVTNIWVQDIPEHDATQYAICRYVTSSGKDYWLWLLVNKDTRKVIGMAGAPDHVAYGNGNNFEKMPHPFRDYNSAKHEIVLIEKAQAKEIQKEAENKNMTVLELVNSLYKLDDSRVYSYEPIHSGLFSPEHKPVLVNKIPDYIQVKKLIRKNK
jgi:hypothetical protein